MFDRFHAYVVIRKHYIVARLCSATLGTHSPRSVIFSDCEYVYFIPVCPCQYRQPSPSLEYQLVYLFLSCNGSVSLRFYVALSSVRWWSQVEF